MDLIFDKKIEVALVLTINDRIRLDIEAPTSEGPPTHITLILRRHEAFTLAEAIRRTAAEAES